jgi:hypothetical protein
MPSAARHLGAASLIALLAACSGGADTDAPVDTDTEATLPTTGTLDLTLRIDDDFGQAVLDDGESLVGRFWGDLYLSEEVSGIGPAEGAVALASFDLDGVDLSSFEATAVLATVTDLPAGYVTALGFFDSDGNADPSAPGPDSGDPVTLPNENEIEVLAGETTVGEIYFGFRNP